MRLGVGGLGDIQTTDSRYWRRHDGVTITREQYYYVVQYIII